LESHEIVLAVLRAAAILMLVMGMLPVAARLECRFRSLGGGAFGRRRLGPVQMAADVVKLLSKREDGSGRGAALAFASALAFVASVGVAASIPFSPGMRAWGTNLSISVCDMRSGLLFTLAMISLWTLFAFVSRLRIYDKRSFIGALGLTSTYFSYFLAMLLSVAGLLIVSGTMDLGEMVADQGGAIWRWNLVRQPAAFVIFVISLCSAARAPFASESCAVDDDASAERTPFAGISAALCALSGRVLLFAGAALIAAAFLGGWQIPFLSYGEGVTWFAGWMPGWAGFAVAMALGFAAMMTKTVLVMALCAWAMANVPRLREDQFSSMGWKVLLPLAMVNAVITAYIVLRIG